jgi:hypothetical protein
MLWDRSPIFEAKCDLLTQSLVLIWRGVILFLLIEAGQVKRTCKEPSDEIDQDSTDKKQNTVKTSDITKKV